MSGLVPVDEIARRLNDCALELCRELLPNGRKSGNVWQFSGMGDTGNSWSAWCYISGPRVGHWQDAGNAMAGEERGDMLDLIRIRMGLADSKAAIAEAKDRLGIHDTFEGRPRQISAEERAAQAEAARRRAMQREAEEKAEFERKARGARALYLHEDAVGIAGTPAEAYLRGRMIDMGQQGRWPGALRFHPEVWYKPERVKIPAMLAPIYRADGVHIGTHRTYLDCARGQWGKIGAPDAKKVTGNMWGGFIPIAKGASGKSMAKMLEGEPVYMCEGIEDALCIRMMRPEARIVSTISVGNMGAVILPPAARSLVLVCDRDDKVAAQDQLERAIAAQQARGLDVRIVMPPAPHKDINDWWRALCQERAA